jgi:UDPglucose 6-dehydrogenase
MALDVEAPLLSAIHRANAVHQRQIVTRLERLLGGPGSLADRRIGLLGLAFKANTDDVRESPAMALAANLRAVGANVLAHDPRAEARARLVDPLLRVASTPIEAVTGADAVVVATEWADYGHLDWTALAAVMRGTLVYDTRSVVDIEAARAAGLQVVRLGRPTADSPVPEPAASSASES